MSLVALGGYACWRGYETLAWPRADATILDARMWLRETTPVRPRRDGVTGHAIREETASFHVTFRYSVNGIEYVSRGVEPFDLGMQNSAVARSMGWSHRTGDSVPVAYNPAQPAEAYLVPGPSSMAKMVLGIGLGLSLVGLWTAWAIKKAPAHRRSGHRAVRSRSRSGPA